MRKPKIGEIYEAEIHYNGKDYKALIQLAAFVNPYNYYHTRKYGKDPTRFSVKVLKGKYPYTSISSHNLKTLNFKRDKVAELLYSKTTGVENAK
jgi:hypothetical protein